MGRIRTAPAPDFRFFSGTCCSKGLRMLGGVSFGTPSDFGTLCQYGFWLAMKPLHPRTDMKP